MPFATFIDIVNSRKLSVDEFNHILSIFDTTLVEFNSRFKTYIISKGSICSGDGVKLLTRHWLPPLYFLHKLLIHQIRFRVGFGVGLVFIIRTCVDECNGPALWSAHEALEQSKKMKLPFFFIIDESASREEKVGLSCLVLSFLQLLRMTQTQRIYSFEFLWNNRSVKEISELFSVSKSAVSVALKRSGCRFLKLIFDLHFPTGI